MTNQSVQPSVTPLRRRTLEDMAMRGLREDTQRDYIRFVKSFAGFLGRSPDTATAEDVRRFQVHQHESGAQPPTINNSVSALRFFFSVTLDRPDLSRRLVLVRHPRKLPAVLNAEQLRPPTSRHPKFDTDHADTPCCQTLRRANPSADGLHHTPAQCFSPLLQTSRRIRRVSETYKNP